MTCLPPYHSTMAAAAEGDEGNGRDEPGHDGGAAQGQFHGGLRLRHESLLFPLGLHEGFHDRMPKITSSTSVLTGGLVLNGGRVHVSVCRTVWPTTTSKGSRTRMSRQSCQFIANRKPARR